MITGCAVTAPFVFRVTAVCVTVLVTALNMCVACHASMALKVVLIVSVVNVPVAPSGHTIDAVVITSLALRVADVIANDWTYAQFNI